jgi:hypothetical protein
MTPQKIVIKHNDIEVRRPHLQSRAAIESESDSMIFCLEALLENGRHLLLVFNDKDSHMKALPTLEHPYFPVTAS